MVVGHFGAATLAGLAAAPVALVRPALAPMMLVPALVFWLWQRQHAATRRRALVLGLAVAGGAFIPLAAYLIGNSAANGCVCFPRLQKVFVSKVYQYQLNGSSAGGGQAGQAIQQSSNDDTLVASNPDVQRNRLGQVGAYARALLLGHLLSTAHGFAGDLGRIWLGSVRGPVLLHRQLYACPSSPGGLLTDEATGPASAGCTSMAWDAGSGPLLVSIASTFLYVGIYPLLPICLVLSIIAVRRRRGDFRAYVLLAMSLCVVVTLIGIGAGRPEVADRYRVPVDALMLISILALPTQLRLAFPWLAGERAPRKRAISFLASDS